MSVTVPAPTPRRVAFVAVALVLPWWWLNPRLVPDEEPAGTLRLGPAAQAWVEGQR